MYPSPLNADPLASDPQWRRNRETEETEDALDDIYRQGWRRFSFDLFITPY